MLFFCYKKEFIDYPKNNIFEGESNESNNSYKYKEQYENIELVYNNKFHDRFIILDYKILYHSGASFKDLGQKYFSINKIENEEIL